jgi:F420-0:gamma-glutamyl ligase
MKRYEVIGVEGLPEIGRGDDLAAFIHETARGQQTPLESRDILVVSQKIVSKTEGRLVRLSEVTPSARAQALALELGRDPKLTEVILSESRRVVRGDKGLSSWRRTTAGSAPTPASTSPTSTSTSWRCCPRIPTARRPSSASASEHSEGCRRA